MEQCRLQIDAYEEKDLIEILEIERDSFPSPWTPGLFKSEKENPISRMLVGRNSSEQGMEVVGYIVFWRVVDEIHLHNIAVRRDRRKCGVASQLLSRMIMDCRPEGVRYITLEVRRSNLPAQRLYEGFGFMVSGVRRGYYEDTGEDALIMSADLEKMQGEGSHKQRRGNA